MSKFFFLISVTALAGAFAVVEGCSSDSSDQSADTDAGADSSPPRTQRDAAPQPVEDAGPAVCPTTDPIAESDIPTKWQPPPPIMDGGLDDSGDAGPGCSQANIDALKAAFAASTSGSVKYTEIKTALGAACSACVFSPYHYDDGGLATTWSVFIDTDGGAYDNRSGSCFAHWTGSDNCGKLRYEFEQCLRIACTTTDCTTDAKLTQCRKDAQKVACKDITNSYVTACGAIDEATLLQDCNIYGAIATQCSGGPDAGIDATSP